MAELHRCEIMLEHMKCGTRAGEQIGLFCTGKDFLTHLGEIVRSRRSWKPNVQEKRLFSYVHDQHIRVKVTTHALRCIDKAGGIDEYLLKTPYNKMDTEMGIVWKANIEKMYSDLAEIEVGFFPPEVEAKIKKGLDEVRAAKRDFRREGRRALAKQSQLEASSVGDDQTSEVIDTKQVFAAKV
uniref:Large ribosomal subunit protein bL28m n=1 Tax=Zea mays TaxID=4577 RepID=A0A804MRN2_MAIZE